MKINDYPLHNAGADDDLLLIWDVATSSTKQIKLADLKTYFGSAAPPSVNTAINLTYQSDGDTNGLFYYLGTNKNTTAWANPVTANKVGVFYSSILAGFPPVDTLVDRQPSAFHTNADGAPFIGFDLLDNKLILKYWTYRTRETSNDHIPNRLVVSVSNDNINYIEVSDRSFAPATNTYNSFPVFDQSIGYRYFKFREFGASYFTAGEFELYGILA